LEVTEAFEISGWHSINAMPSLSNVMGFPLTEELTLMRVRLWNFPDGERNEVLRVLNTSMLFLLRTAAELELI
jgi:hypothetical protein